MLPSFSCFRIVLCIIATTFANISFGQLNKKNEFSRQDTLRGSVGPGRLKWDVLHYDISVEPDYALKTIRGSNTITYFDSGVKLMQLDLQMPMEIDSIIKEKNSIKFRQDGNVYW